MLAGRATYACRRPQNREQATFHPRHRFYGRAPILLLYDFLFQYLRRDNFYYFRRYLIFTVKHILQLLILLLTPFHRYQILPRRHDRHISAHVPGVLEDFATTAVPRDAMPPADYVYFVELMSWPS